MTIILDEDPWNADWLRTLRWPDHWAHLTSADELAQTLAEEGWSVEAFKDTPLYQAALERGDPPWLAEL